MEELERDKRYFLEQFVLNQAYNIPNLSVKDAVENANIAWIEIQKLLPNTNT